LALRNRPSCVAAEKGKSGQDQQFAKMWIENRNDYHPRSQRLMRYELRIKGVAEQTIESALADSADDLELATRAAAQYARKLNFQDRVLFRKKLSAFLARRGFSYGTISPVIRDLICALEQDQSNILENEDDNGKY
jgi:regulatory protein